MSIRVFVLIAAIACLGLAMCAYSERSKPATPTNAEQAPPPGAAPGSAPGSANGSANAPAAQKPGSAQPQPQQLEEGKMGKEPRYFPATKAPGSFR